MCHYIETICIENGQIQNLTAHNQRMNATRMALFGEVAPIDLAGYLDPKPHRLRTKCRVEYAREIISIEYTLYTLRPVSLLHLVTSNDIDYTFKSADRSKLNELFSQRGEADDILIVKNSRITDTTICNIALWNGRIWETPLNPLLKGTRCSQLIREGIISESDILADSLQGYTRIRLFNAMIKFGEIEINIAKIK